MSTKTHRKDDKEEVTEANSSEQQFQREQHEAVNKVLDETIDNIKKTTNEARKEIPRYTQIVNDYQENTIQSIREITDNYVDSQKDIIVNSFRLWSDWIPSSRHVAENYGKIVSSFADNAVAATRVLNNIVFASLDSVNTSIQHTKENVKELSIIGANTVKTFQQVSSDNIHNTTTTTKNSNT
jgi:thiol-disulfide isomerase/thioredoxin